jgi:hypothetical protein
VEVVAMAKKKRKSVLPKRIAGVKVPKAVRKGRFGELLASRMGQALLAEAIMAAGAVMAKNGGDKADDKASVGPQLGESVAADAFRRWQTQGKPADAARATVAYALGEAARTFVRTLNEARDHDRGGSDIPGEYAAPRTQPRDGSKKNFTPSPPGAE